MVDRFLLIDLPVFLEVARQGNMTKAAAALHTVQSNITARIKRLEEHLGTTLVVRSPRKLRLTPEGEALMPFALRLEQLCRDVRTHFEQDDRPQGGSLRIGAIETFAASHLVGLIARFTERNPAVDISVQTGGTDSLWQKVLDSELDVAFVSRRANDSAFFEEKVFEDSLVVIARNGTATFADLAKPEKAGVKIFVQRIGCSFTARLTDYLQETGIPRRPMHAVGTLEGVIGSVRAGGGIAVLPRSYLNSAPGAHELSQTMLPGKFGAVEIFLVVQRWKLPIRLLDSFVQSCLDHRIPEGDRGGSD
ncbi:MAG: LysR family transcriptional regulator [Terrimicrobiaceae bacterium]